MKKEVIVLSLGGSLIIPEKINKRYLDTFKKVILRLNKKYKFVIVCGGGSIARDYIEGLKDTENKFKLQSLMGIASTRLNARFMTYFFGKDAPKGIPHDMVTVKHLLKRNDNVFCGALRYAKDQTSDSTSAKLANYLNTIFVNLTNVKGLHDKNPQKYKNARFIPEISWEEFEKMANASKFTPGQHFVLDQTAAKIIKKEKIPTYIVGKNIKQLENLLSQKPFIGTQIKG